MRTLWLLCLLVTIPGWAAATRVTLQLPPDIEYPTFSQSGDTFEIKLSAAAFKAKVVATGLAVGPAENACVLYLTITPGERPEVTFIPVASGPIVATATKGDAAGSNPSFSPDAAPTQPGTPRPAKSGTPPPPPESAGTATAAPVAPPASTTGTDTDTGSDKLNDLFRQALDPLAGPVKFDPMAMADYAIPASGAAMVIGSAGTLTRPGTPREVVTGLLTDFDEEGRLQTGFSLAFTPYTLLREKPLTADEYQKEYSKRFLANLQVSLAGRLDESVVTDGNTAARFGVGLSMVLFDQGDLRLDNDFLLDLTVNKLKSVFSAADVYNSASGQAPAATSPEKLTAGAKSWKEKAAENWNAPSGGLGVAPAFLSLTGKLDDAHDDGVMVWANFSLRGPGALKKNTQIIVGGNSRFRQRTLTNSVWTRTDVIDVGAQLRWGGAAGNFFAEGQYRQRDDGTTETDKFVYELGFERRVTDNVWLNASWTNDDAVSGGKLIRTGVRFGFGEKAVLSPLKK